MSYCYYTWCIRTNRIKFIDLKFDQVNKYKFIYGILVDNRYQPPIFPVLYEDIVKQGSIQALELQENQDVSIIYDYNIFDNKHKKPALKAHLKVTKLGSFERKKNHEIEQNKFYTLITSEARFITINSENLEKITDLLERGVIIRKIWGNDETIDKKTTILVSQCSILAMKELGFQPVDGEVNTIYYL